MDWLEQESTNTVSFNEMMDNLKITAEDIENAEDLEYSVEPLIHPKNDLALIHTEGLDEGIRCAMCTNSMKSDRGCDGSCAVNDAMYKKVMDVIESNIANLPSVTPQEPILDKIRAEIEARLCDVVSGYTDGYRTAIQGVLVILDKYNTKARDKE